MVPSTEKHLTKHSGKSYNTATRVSLGQQHYTAGDQKFAQAATNGLRTGRGIGLVCKVGVEWLKNVILEPCCDGFALFNTMGDYATDAARGSFGGHSIA